MYSRARAHTNAMDLFAFLFFLARFDSLANANATHTDDGVTRFHTVHSRSVGWMDG
jgi:hypothetical protein